MSRRAKSESEEAFSLFPFLAVLLCTMGTLALVFVLVARKTAAPTENPPANEVARAEFDRDAALGDDSRYGSIVDSAEDDAYERALVRTGAASLDDVLSEKESVEWFLQELDEIESHSNETFAEERQRLANAEAGIAKLRDEADVAQRRYDALVKENAEAVDVEALKNRIAELDREIEKLQEEAAELREKNASAKKSYAIVPYQGKKGTFRRPIYVECRDDGVYLQPEGVRFDDSDFLLAQYPGNPFDTALRAASQRCLATDGQKTASGDAIEPYPLIIARPSGAKYFYSAIAALASWGDLYGYEFVEEDQELVYPEPDPELRKLAQAQADEARARMRGLLATALSIRNARIVSEERRRREAASDADRVPDSELQARLGSNVRLGAAKPLAGTSKVYANAASVASAPVAKSGEPESQGAVVAAVPREPSAPSGSPGDALVVGGASPKRAVFTGAADAAARSARLAGGNGTGDLSASAADHDAELVASGGAGNEGFDENASYATSGSGSTAARDDDSETNAERGTTTCASRSAPPAGSTAPAYMKNFIAAPDASRVADPSKTRDLTDALGNTSLAAWATGDSTDGELADAPQRAESTASDASDPNAVSSVFEKTVDLDEPPEKKKELREDEKTPPEAFLVSRELTRTATRGNERGILVRCEPDAFVFPKQPGLRAVGRVAAHAEGSTRASRDAELADVVTLCVKSWGVAGRNMYWAPYVKAEVSPGGEATLAALREFCDAQGLTLILVESKTAR